MIERAEEVADVMREDLDEVELTEHSLIQVEKRTVLCPRSTQSGD